jgi:hypothetical protein
VDIVSAQVIPELRVKVLKIPTCKESYGDFDVKVYAMIRSV